MGWTLSAFTIVVFGSAIVAIGVGLFAVRERPDPLAWPLAVTMFAVAAWALPHAISFGYASVERVSFWSRMRYPGVVVAPVAYLILALRYAGYDRWLSRRVYAVLAVVPATTVVIVWTNPSGLFWQSLSVAQVGRASVLVEEVGPWFWVNLGYLYVVTLVALAALGAAITRLGPLYRKQTVVMFVAGLVPLVTNAAVEFGLGPDPMVDITTTALAVTGLAFALALFHFDLLEVRPVARERLFDQLDDGVVVVGPDGRIRDINPTAARILGDVTLGQPAETVFPSDVAPDGGELVVETDAGTRRFRTRSTALTDRHGREIGRIIHLNDITAIVEHEQRISILNRILRHNIRNELDIATGHLKLLEDRASAAEQEHIEQIRASTDRVLEFAEKARHVERTLQASDAAMVVSAGRIVDRVVTDAQESFSDTVIAYDRSDGSATEAIVRVVDRDLFEMAVTELVENAVVHNDQESPRVTVRLTADSDTVQVSVADNGPGIPDQETDVLLSTRETSLEHGSGLGLWLVTWFASLSGGDLSFGANDPRGSVVTLTLPSGGE